MTDPSTSPPKNVTLKSDPEYNDLLHQDNPVAGQQFVCMSFVSPEEIIKNKDMFMFDKFLNQWELRKSLEKFNQFMAFISYKYELNHSDLTSDFDEFCKTEKDKLFVTTLDDEYKTFVENNREKLTEEFCKEHSFATNVRGVKVRGSYPSQQEAELRAKLLREADPSHDVYVGQVGVWLPFDQNAYKTGRVEYMEEELNQLMNEKAKNEQKAKAEFEARVKESKFKAIEENKKKAMETGNVLTQTIDEEGNLISVNGMNTFDNQLGHNATKEEIHDRLFNDDNVVIDKNTDHGLSDLLETQKSKKD